jgi:DNA-binding winged helix-turn-helix (wHTH) protein/tetratricopeptide (TPR) repeat protein
VNDKSELRFDGWTVNRISGEMTKDGRATRLPQQPLRILLELYDNAGAIVTREQLVKTLWPTGIVDFDNGLNVAVRKLRLALDDVGDAPKYIETLPKVGYRFTAPAVAVPAVAVPPEALHAPSPPRELRNRRLILAISLGVVAAAIGVAWWWSTEQAVVDSAAARVPAAPSKTTARPKHVPSVRAREFYLEGLSQRSRRDINASRLAMESFQAALREDPDYAEAWAAFADVNSGMVIRHMVPYAEGIPAAHAAAKRAIELDETLPQGHIALAQILLDQERDFAASQVVLERARAINDQSSRLWHAYAMWHAHQGHVDEALADIRKARELEPMVLLYQSNYAMILYNARRYEDAIAYLSPILEANPKFTQARSVLANALMATGDLAGAERQLDLRPIPDLYQAERGYLAARQGKLELARREIVRLEGLARDGYGTGYAISTIYTALGDLDRGCEYLARAVDDHSILLAWMRLDPHMDPLRGRKCFADVEKRVYATAPDAKGD